MITFLIVLNSPSNWAFLKGTPTVMPVVTNLCKKFTVNYLTPQVLENFNIFLLKALKRSKVSSNSDIVNAVLTVILR